ncbi:hypothetical protein M427DRAFT_220003 [Gonapodya prolifera JEL478]|uniref:Uncharacterized protein n=1 Tax=Gonapodya prolifera (strain JEL478) TaxID=1344416 RepID=A0A138ZYJ3_GONPJ|nr:hypothetical protein M427DRAFT_220003 [Gonapodya prolifera JEL478]|eukprot:KXS09569.1 hypothetical protein M427DRAFT_220003 [Gonapodya prolifera JEL478]
MSTSGAVFTIFLKPFGIFGPMLAPCGIRAGLAISGSEVVTGVSDAGFGFNDACLRRSAAGTIVVSSARRSRITGAADMTADAGGTAGGGGRSWGVMFGGGPGGGPGGSPGGGRGNAVAAATCCTIAELYMEGWYMLEAENTGGGGGIPGEGATGPGGNGPFDGKNGGAGPGGGPRGKAGPETPAKGPGPGKP